MEHYMTGTMTLTTPAAATVMECEIKGQMSDGAWENSNPSDHWKFWNDLTVEVGDKNFVTSKDIWQCRKAGYGLTSLIEYVGERMIAQGRMATALNRLLTRDEGDAAEYMPASFDEFLCHKNNNDWKHDFVKKYMDGISLEMAQTYYATEYTEKDLRQDLKRIREAIKSVKARR